MGSLLGYGIGHGVQGTWLSGGWAFTAITGPDGDMLQINGIYAANLLFRLE